MKQTTEIEEVPLELLAEPLDWFFAEHYRHRQLCQMIDEVCAATVFDGDKIGKVVAFLGHDLALHVIDEEQDFFPLLRRRCLPEDEVERVLGMLSAEHRADVAKASQVSDILKACLLKETAPGLDPGRRKVLAEFASQERRHLGLENAVILPIARLRLDAEDLATLGRRLAARRGRVLSEPGA